MKRTISALLAQLNLGDLIGEPTPVQGGYLHRMFRVETTAGCYAVKALNPDIMQRPEALGNMRRGELVALAAPLEGFDVCAAVDGQVLAQDGAWYMVYPWVEGRSVFPPEITVEHCRIMGDVLGQLHAADIQVDGMAREGALRPAFDWALLEDDRAAAWDACALAGLARLREKQVISHRDLDPKNVLWRGMRPCIIDWEAAGYVSPWQELVEVLNYWAADEKSVRELVAAYGRHMDLSAVDWEAALAAGMDGMLGWLHYNLCRREGLEGSAAADRQEGEGHVRATLQELQEYDQRAAQLRQWIKM